MTSRKLARKTLQARLALAYAAGIYAAGMFMIVIVAVPLAGIEESTKGPPTSTITEPGAGPEPGIGLSQLLTGSTVALIVLIPVALALGWFVAGRFLRPLRAITATAKIISAGDLHRRLALGGPTDELTDLGHTLDDLFARLQASFDAQRHFVANASHELRTPLAGQRTLLEVALADPAADADSLRSACREALELGGQQERLIQSLLTLATSERGVVRRDTLDLADVVETVLASRRDRAAATGLDLRAHLGPAVTTGDRRLIESLVANLIDNAIQHNHEAGHVEVTTQTSSSQAALTVTNSGPVIADDQLRRLRQPFQRLTPDRGSVDGFGLGLAIVDGVAQAHQATLSTSPRAEGGLSITVRFASGATSVRSSSRRG